MRQGGEPRPTTELGRFARTAESLDAGGAAGGDVAGQQGDGGEDCGDYGERDWVGGIDAKEHGAKDAGDGDRSGDADDQANGDDEHTFADGHPQDVVTQGAECHVDADFVGTLAEGVVNYAVDSDRGEQQSRRCEDAEQFERESAVGHGALHDLVHRDDAVDGDVWSQAFNHVADGVAELRGRDVAGSEKHHRVDRSELAERYVNVRHAGRFVSVGLDVAGDADDGQALEAATKIEFQLVTDGIGVGPILFREPFIYDGDAARFVGVEIGEVAARNQRHAHRPEIAGVDDGDIGERLGGWVVRASRDREEGIVAP